MQNNIDKVDIVASNYAENDIDYSGIIASIAKGDLTLDGYKFLLRSVYKQGFKRGVERMKKSNNAAWIDYDANHGLPFTCRCGNCGYVSYIGDSNFCPECGRKMDLKFGSQEARNIYEKIAKHKIEMRKANGYSSTLNNPSFSTTLKEVMYRIKQLQESFPTLPEAIIDDTCEHVWINSGNDIYKEYDLISTQDEHIDFVSKELNYLEDDIQALKKRIKYAKTPMEKKQLSQQLNLAYKKRKDNRK